MGKAFSDEERKLIRGRIKEESFKLFRINGIRKTSISEITKNVGISQGGFYTFYKNKEEVFYDITESDIDTQIEHCLSYLEESIKDPAGTLYTCIEHHCRHMQESHAIWIDEPDIMEILRQRNEEDILREKEKFRKVLVTMKEYWIKNQCIKSMDIEKLLSVFLMARTMYINKECCDENNFKEIFEAFIKIIIKKYLILE